MVSQYCLLRGSVSGAEAAVDGVQQDNAMQGLVDWAVVGFNVVVWRGWIACEHVDGAAALREPCGLCLAGLCGRCRNGDSSTKECPCGVAQCVFANQTILQMNRRYNQ